MSSANLNGLHIVRAVAPIAAALVLLSLGAAPSSARPDSKPHFPATDHPIGCQLQRVGTQFVRCDDLTGNGVAAPAWIPSPDSTTPRESFASIDAHVAVAVSARFTLDPEGTLLPGDVRVWELNHPAGVTPALLPGDLRQRERGGPAGPSAPVT